MIDADHRLVYLAATLAQLVELIQSGGLYQSFVTKPLPIDSLEVNMFKSIS